ncbi:hypothetical protein [Acuticoccus sediminis]|uniref:hypothetical protein n=1 Tax=Acuticoccus sediminis TaxID=2184697 RepID=UPI001CFE4103|nr:hypothetical protein [Acuticoccus sediminis]
MRNKRIAVAAAVVVASVSVAPSLHAQAPSRAEWRERMATGLYGDFDRYGQRVRSRGGPCLRDVERMSQEADAIRQKGPISEVDMNRLNNLHTAFVNAAVGGEC